MILPKVDEVVPEARMILLLNHFSGEELVEDGLGFIDPKSLLLSRNFWIVVLFFSWDLCDAQMTPITMYA